MKVLELFCGTKSFSNVAKEQGHAGIQGIYNETNKNTHSNR